MHEKNRLCVLRAVIEYYYMDDNHNHLNVMQYNEVHIPTAVTQLFWKKYNLMLTL